MIHYSCDRCRRPIDNEDEIRYSVRIEVQASMGVDAMSEDFDEDRDHLLEIHEILEHADDVDDPLISDEIYQRQRYDLCSDERLERDADLDLLEPDEPLDWERRHPDGLRL